MSNESRAHMVESAASLIGSRGVNATSFSDVLSDSGAPRGSIYHHFPGGKSELTADAVRWTTSRVVAYLESGPKASPRGVLERFIELWRRLVVASAGTAGCAVAGVAIDTAGDAPLMAVVRSAFRSWLEVLAQQLEAGGLGRDRAVAIAEVSLAAMEGALILCRAEGNSGPLEVVASELMRLVELPG